VVGTATPTSSTVNGNATLKMVGAVSGHNPEASFWWTDNTNWWSAVVLPTDANGQLAAEGIASGSIINSMLAHAAITVQGQTCTLGLPCNINSVTTAHGVALNEGSATQLGGTAVGATGTVLCGNTAADPSFCTVPIFAATNLTGNTTLAASDFATFASKYINSGTFTVTLVASGSQPANGQAVLIENFGTGTITVARSGQNINGAAGNIPLTAGSATAPTGGIFISDGTNYEYYPLGGSGGASGVTSFTGDGALLNNSASTGPVTATLVNAGAGTVWGNNTGSSASPSYTPTPNLGVSGTAGTLGLFAASGNFKTTLGSAATASNTFNFPAAVFTTGHMGYCVTSSTTCTWTDTGYAYNAIPFTDLSGNATIAQGGTNATSAAVGSIPNAVSTTSAPWTITPTLGNQNTTAGGLTIAGSSSAGGGFTLNGTGASPGSVSCSANTAGTAMSCTSSGSSNVAIGTAGSTTGTLTLESSTATGGISLSPAAAASQFTLTLPAATDTLVDLAGTQSLTNKTVNGVVLSSSGSSTQFLNQAGSYATVGGGNVLYCSGSASATAATCAGVPSGATTYTNMTGFFIAGATSTGAPLTANVNSLGAKNVYLNGIATSASNIVMNGYTYPFYYDGTEIQLTAPLPVSNAPWVPFSGYPNTAGMTSNSVEIWAIPNGPAFPQKISSIFYDVTTDDTNGAHYYDIGIYGPCASAGTGCPLVADLGSGSQGINLGSTGVKNTAITQGTVTLTPPAAGQYYYIALTGNAATAVINAVQMTITPLSDGNGGSSTSGQLPSTITIPTLGSGTWSASGNNPMLTFAP
jgi:hypothetical protein